MPKTASLAGPRRLKYIRLDLEFALSWLLSGLIATAPYKWSSNLPQDARIVRLDVDTLGVPLTLQIVMESDEWDILPHGSTIPEFLLEITITTGEAVYAKD